MPAPHRNMNFKKLQIFIEVSFILLNNLKLVVRKKKTRFYLKYSFFARGGRNITPPPPKYAQIKAVWDIALLGRMTITLWRLLTMN